MIKPKILSDEEIKRIYLNRAIEQYGVEGGTQIISQLTTIGNGKAIAQAQNDYCYKEMLIEFEKLIPENPWIKDDNRGCNPDKRVAVDIVLDKIRSALQGLEG